MRADRQSDIEQIADATISVMTMWSEQGPQAACAAAGVQVDDLREVAERAANGKPHDDPSAAMAGGVLVGLRLADTYGDEGLPASPAELSDYGVQIALPGSRRWCEACVRAFNDWTARATTENAPMFGVLPAVSVQPDDGGQFELVLVWVDLPASGAGDAIGTALKVLGLMSPELAAHPAARVLVHDQAAVGE